VSLDRLWAGWRSRYVSEEAGRQTECFLCAVATLADPAESEASLVVERTPTTIVVMNLYPYGSGHLLVAPRPHVPDLDALDRDIAHDVMDAIGRAARALREAYGCDGLNIGFNLGTAAGAGVPDHLHAHVLPRWHGDTNFMTAIAETRVVPESLASGWEKVRAAWPVA
jgi:ATP adenylyltransferase